MNEHTFSLGQIWSQGDSVSHAVAIILVIMSLASWSVILVKAWGLVQLRRMSAGAKQFWHTTSFDDGMAALTPASADNPFRDLAARSTEAVSHHVNHQDELHGVLNLNDWVTSTMRQSIDDTTGRMQAGLSILASVGATAPFVGLFGTVWGIYHALVGIGAAGQATLDKVAGPVGEALVMTAGGLAVAIPAVLGYNALVRGNKEILARLKHFAHDLHAYLVTGGKVRRHPARIHPLPTRKEAQ
ncbi:MotA/TolQ/ExbB proton channel family protein [Zoogloea dura]|jgi:biopolymer transport protein ExbB|uniref:Biopolymer transport protein ExbB n=1 Tax=Zoogloea dura TaxID=2728840 RepID=A0A848G3Y7_9RHOO|nr:MotA/TolQ/ExbB proton channel family protein [Zoogloea dura]NML24391.1 MotA/TolQ/ExbB proton channel family protein [Zoogloea dura]